MPAKKMKLKKISNPFSTGGGGTHFEAHVQASYLALMLTGGFAPALPAWPITEIKLQGKIDGFETDDFVVTVESAERKQKRRLLGQIKHSISITTNDRTFSEVMLSAWKDFNNERVFTKNRDAIALITGPLSGTDANIVPWILNQARTTKNADEFYRHVRQANFSPAGCEKKLEVIRRHLRMVLICSRI